jgi:para-aminobenzoate synthetase component 1
MDRFLQSSGTIREIIDRPIELQEGFSSLAAKCAEQEGSVVLLSGGDSDCARSNLLAVRPWLCLRAWGDLIEIKLGSTRHRFRRDPFEAIRAVCSTFNLPATQAKPPVSAGLFGYLAYDLKDRLERLPQTCLSNPDLPDACLFAPSILIIQDIHSGSARLRIPRLSSAEACDADQALAAAADLLTAPPPQQEGFEGKGSSRSCFSQAEYVRAVEAVKEYIKDGHVYQVNLSQRFSLDFSGSPFSYFCKLFAINPAPFFSFINAGDHQVVSTSPERFLSVAGKTVETRPIKGTRPRGQSGDEDSAKARELLDSRKDDAELSMIVDLLRNDLGKVCQAGSVYVREHKRLEGYSNVFHLLSLIEGRLKQGIDQVDLLRAAFPGGSITGCPKIRAMEIIDELEPVKRHVYTGSIGYLGFDGSMDLSIAIRTAVIRSGRLHFSVGGGIVFDSDPYEEYDETLHKGKSLIRLLQGGHCPAREQPERVWFDGRLMPAEEALVPAVSPGLQYGFGLFETLRADAGRICLLDEHLARFQASWRSLYGQDPPKLSWESIIQLVLAANGLLQATAAVKILACKAAGRSTPPWHLLVSAAAYQPRLSRLDKPGLDLAVYPEPRLTPLADHKSLNYLYYHQAGQWALDNGSDEAVILNPDGSLSETNTANLVLISNHTAVVPRSRHVLPGVTVQRCLELLTAWGYRTERRACSPQSLHDCDQVLLTNSLIGAAPALSLDGRQLPQSRPELAPALVRQLFPAGEA